MECGAIQTGKPVDMPWVLAGAATIAKARLGVADFDLFTEGVAAALRAVRDVSYRQLEQDRAGRFLAAQKAREADRVDDETPF